MYSNTKFKLIPLTPNTKKPRDINWQKDDYEGQCDSNQVAIAHKQSGTCSLDIDNYTKTHELFKEKGIDLTKLCNEHIGILSSNPNHYKLLFTLDVPMTTKKVTIGNETIFEFRCVSAEGLTSKDVIPPSIHPKTKQPYQWYGDYHQLTPLPEELQAVWRGLLHNNREVIKSKVDTDWEEIEEMLEHIDPDCDYEEWISVCMAIHHFDYLSPDKQGEELFLTWSEKGEKFTSDEDIRYTWGSITYKEDGVGLGSLFKLAREYGWKQKEKDTSHLFQPTNQPDPTVTLKDPLDIMNGLRPPAPNLDMALLPEVISLYSLELSDTIGSDPLSSAFAMLASVAGTADARSRLEVIDGYEVPPVIWCMTVGDPSFKKTPATKPVFQVFKEIERENKQEYQRSKAIWEGDEARYAKNRKDYLANCIDGEMELTNDVANEPPDPLRPEPVPLRMTVGDITSQQLVRHCADRPQGILCYLDEMSAWVDKMTNPRSGEVRSSWIVAHNSDSYELDRVGTGSTYCENLAVSIFGNIQPKVLRRAMSNLSRDGMMQRFIPVILRKKYNKVGEPRPKELSLKPLWNNIIRSVHNLCETHYRFSNEAYQEFRLFQIRIEELKRVESESLHDSLVTALGKVDGLCARLCLVFHLIENSFSVEVHIDIVKRVIELVESYIIPSYRYTYNEIAGEADNNIAVWMTNYIMMRAIKHQTVTISDIKRSGRRFFKRIDIDEKAIPNLIKNEMAMLESYRWVTLVEEKLNSCLWLITPSLKTSFMSYRDNLVKMKQAQLDLVQSEAKERRFVDGYHDAMSR